MTVFGVAAAMMTLIVSSVRQLLPSHTGIPPLAAGLLFVYLAACDMRDVLRMKDEPLRVSLSTLGREVAELVPDPPGPLWCGSSAAA